MNFVEYISNSTGYSPATVSSVMDSFWKFVQFSLRGGEPIKIEKFGKFEYKDLEDRKGRNPRTGEEILIPSKRKASFKFSKTFVELIQADAAVSPSFGSPLNEEIAILEPTPEPEEAISSSSIASLTAPPPTPTPKLPEPVPEPVPEPATKKKPRSRKKEETPPPVPQELLAPATGRSWYVAGIDKSIAESQLISQGVKLETPLWNKDSGWKLAKDIPQLNYLFKS